MKKKDKILIQQKIDGMLSDAQEKAFQLLMLNSAKARDFYEKLCLIDQRLKTDAAGVSDLNLCPGVMDNVPVNKNFEVSNRKLITLRTNSILKYAAVLLVGLFLGATFSTIILSKNEFADKNDLYGTIIKRSGSKTLYSNGATSIHLQSMLSGNVSINLFTIETNSEVEFEITNKSPNLDAQNIITVQNGFNIDQTGTSIGDITGIIKGPSVFQLNVLKGNQTSAVFRIGNDVVAKAFFE
jgi:hypothetical protein